MSNKIKKEETKVEETIIEAEEIVVENPEVENEDTKAVVVAEKGSTMSKVWTFTKTKAVPAVIKSGKIIGGALLVGTIGYILGKKANEYATIDLDGYKPEEDDDYTTYLACDDIVETEVSEVIETDCSVTDEE